MVGCCPSRAEALTEHGGSSYRRCVTAMSSSAFKHECPLVLLSMTAFHCSLCSWTCASSNIIQPFLFSFLATHLVFFLHPLLQSALVLLADPAFPSLLIPCPHQPQPQPADVERDIT